MSRIGKLPIMIPAGAEMTFADGVATAKGPKGTLTYTLPEGVRVEKNESQIDVSIVSDDYKNMRGLVRTLLSNMVVGVTQGFEKKLHVLGVGYSAKLQGQKLTLNLGYSHPIDYILPAIVSASLEKDAKGADIVTLHSIDKQLVGEIAAKLRVLRLPEPYKGKGVRYFGEYVKQKAGKTTGKK